MLHRHRSCNSCIVCKRSREEIQGVCNNAKSRQKEALETDGKEVLGSTLFIEKLDVTSEGEINKVVDDILAKEGKLDVLGT